jgi:uncharacterized protein YjbI with pentapeptide repeats
LNWAGIATLIASITAVIALLLGQQSTQDSIDATRDQIAIAQQGQLTDRYSRAIEQLGRQGPDQLQIRLGGIYALERLARDSPRDQPTIIEVLATFVRTSAPITTIATNTPTVTAPRQAWVCPTEAPTSPNPDVQAALTVLSRRDTTHDNNTIPVLSNTCLRGADLSHAALSHADLSHTDLSSAYLGSANLFSANLSGAYVTNANLSDTNLYGANLDRTDLTGTKLSGANLSGADLNRAILTNAYLYAMNLSGAYLYGTDLSGAMLIGTNLKGTNLSKTIHDSNTLVQNVLTDGTTKGKWW